jgi:cytochrome P450
MARPFPEPPEAGILNAVRFGTQTFRFLEGVQSRFDDGMAVPVPGRPPIVVVTDPALARDVLDRRDEFTRVPAQESAAMIAENGLVQSEGDLWEQQRSLVSPAFGGRQVTAYANTTGRRADRLAERWLAAGPQEIDLHRAMTSLTIRVASEILLGEDVGRERAAQFHEWMQVAGEEFEFGIEVALPDWMPTPTSRAFRDAARGIRGLATELIERRRATLATGEAPDAEDMLTLLLRAEDDPDVEYPPNQIRDEVATFLIAGHETTALSLTYTLSLLSWNPDARRRVREEAEAVLGEEPPGHGDLAALEYTERAYREALRLYPPAWAVFRRADGRQPLGEYVVEDGAAVVVPQWSIHRDDRYFEDPRTFDPDRWARRDPNDVDAYFPFSSGPHACVGRGFALSGATLVLARLVRDVDVAVDERALEDLRVTPTLRPADGVAASVRPVARTPGPARHSE